MKMIKAKHVSYGGKRSRTDVKYIVIHYTGNNGDTAENNARYFQKTNERQAGAHFFIDQNGVIIKSIPLNAIAWSVGGLRYPGVNGSGGGKYYKICTNANSVSIELCDNASKDPSAQQINAVKKCIRYIRRFCPNAKTLIRHYDVNGKMCPARMADERKWKNFLGQIGEL